MASPPPPLPVGGQGNGADLLSKVELLSFTATPDHIFPFDSSTLRWRVQSPRGVSFSLDGFATTVPPVGKQVVQPTFTSTFMLQARAGQAGVTLGTVTVSVDSSQCVEQVQTDVAFNIWTDLLAGFVVAAQNHGDKANIPTPKPVPVSIDPNDNNPGIIWFEVKGSLTLMPTDSTLRNLLNVSLDVNMDVQGSFGLTVDRTADRLAPTNVWSNVNCGIDPLTWINFIIAGGVTAGLVGALVGAGISAVFGGIGAVFGVIIGFVAGGIAAAALLSTIVNKVTSAISAAMPGGIQTLVQTGIATWFHEPTGMAMATVSVDPDMAARPDGNITVWYCPRSSGPPSPSDVEVLG